MSIFLAMLARKSSGGARRQAARIALAAICGATPAAAQVPDTLFQETPAAEQPTLEDPLSDGATQPAANPTAPAPSGVETPSAEAGAAAPDAAAGAAAAEPEINVDAQDALLRAQQAASQNNFTQALTEIDEAISLQPDYYDAFALRSMVQRLSRNPQEAVRSAQQAISIKPDGPDAHVALALAYIDMKDYANALKSMEEWLTSSPNNPQAYVVMAHVHQEQKDWAKAVNSATSAIDNSAYIPSVTADALMVRGEAFYHLGEWELAKMDFEQVTTISSFGGEPNRWRGFILAMQGDYPRAIYWFDRAIRANPGNAQAYRNRGMAFLNLAISKPRVNDMASREAVDSFNRAIRLKPNDAQLYYRRGLAFDRLGETEMARSSYETAAKLDPKHRGAAKELAESAYRGEEWYEE